jgi:hypothetical protein
MIGMANMRFITIMNFCLGILIIKELTMEKTITIHDNGAEAELEVYSLMDMYYTLLDEFFYYDIQSIIFKKGFLIIEGCDHREDVDKIAHVQASKREYDYINILLPLKRISAPKGCSIEKINKAYAIN